jgi:hypothetical protein
MFDFLLFSRYNGIKVIPIIQKENNMYKSSKLVTKVGIIYKKITNLKTQWCNNRNRMVNHKTIMQGKDIILLYFFFLGSV